MTIDKKLLIKEQKYSTQLCVYSLFMLGGFGSFFLSFLSAKGPIKIEILLIYMCVTIIPFGIFAGALNIMKTLKQWNKINKGDITIVEMKVLDKQHASMQSSAKHTLLIFGEKNNVYVTAQRGKKYKVGDVCYRVYINSNSSKIEEVGFPYNKKDYVLGEDLKPYLDRTYRQPALDSRYFER